jgi:hypothetical protein
MIQIMRKIFRLPKLRGNRRAAARPLRASPLLSDATISLYLRKYSEWTSYIFTSIPAPRRLVAIRYIYLYITREGSAPCFIEPVHAVSGPGAAAGRTRVGQTMTLLNRKIRARQLTTCSVVGDGEAVRIGLTNEADRHVSLEISLEQAQSLVMTLPRLLSKAFQARTRNPDTRFVFPAGRWTIESSSDAKCLLLTLITTDGFEITFGLPRSQYERMGSALMRLGDTAPASDSAEDSERPQSPVLN